MNALRIGSMCTGYGGLDMVVQAVLGGTVAWHADPDPGSAAVLAHHWPDVPNLGDITKVRWQDAVSVDILAAGYPCQPFSDAGKRKGLQDERHIWPYIATGIRVLRPRIVVLENVAGHLRLGFDTVLADLAALGFDAEWRLVRASDVGAPHRRERLFIVAFDADAADLGHERCGFPWGRRTGPADRGVPAADAERDGLQGQRSDAETGQEWASPAARRCGSVGGGNSPADTDRDGRSWRQERDLQPEAGLEASRRDDADGRVLDWGKYEPAIRRWEHASGRPAPRPTEPGANGQPRLTPVFVEWLMGLPAGHVTDVPGLTRNQQLKALGNGVVPQQGAHALRTLMAHLTQEVAA